MWCTFDIFNSCASWIYYSGAIWTLLALAVLVLQNQYARKNTSHCCPLGPEWNFTFLYSAHKQYIGEVHAYIGNLKWIWILNSLYFKICVNKNSYKFVIIKLQDIFGISKKAFTWKFWPFCFVFISLKNVNLIFYLFA